jgi:hypothetical protein
MLQMDNHLMNNSFVFTFNGTLFISISTKIHVFNGVAVEFKWDNLNEGPIDFITFFSMEI